MMPVGVVVALGMMILRFIFSFYLLYLCLLLSLLCLQRWGEVRTLNPGEVCGVDVSLGQRFYTGLPSAVPNSLGCYTSEWSGESQVVGLWFGSKPYLSSIIWRVPCLRGWKDILTNEHTGWVQEYQVRFLIYRGVWDSWWVLYTESPATLKQLLQT